MKLPFSEPDRPDLERRLRSSAGSFAPLPPPELRARILGALRRAAEQPETASIEPTTFGRARSELRGNWIAAAAALLVLVSAWWLTRASSVQPARARSVVALSREFLDASTRALSLPAQAEDSLRLEAERLLHDTTRMAEGLVRGLPAPLRSTFERM